MKTLLKPELPYHLQPLTCDCGHTVTLEESTIHSIASFDNSDLVDLCDDCFSNAELLEEAFNPLSTYRFPSLEAETKYKN